MKLLIVGLLALAARGDVIIQDVSNAGSSEQGSSDHYTLKAVQFDPTLGTLNSILFNYSDFQTILYSLTNGNNMTAGTPFTITAAFSSAADVLPISLSHNGPPVTYISEGFFDPFASGRSSATMALSGSFYSDSFVGTGQVDLNFISQPKIYYNGSYELTSYIFSTQDSPRLILTYNYTSVSQSLATPEPRWSVLALFLMALPAFALLRRT